MNKEYLDLLKGRYVNATTEKEREEVREAIRQQMEEILPFISLAYMAKTYFGKSRQWLYQ